MGQPSPSDPLAPRTPVGTLVLTDRPTFRWTSVAAATTYRVEVYDENLLHVGDDARVGALVIVALEGHGRAHARLAEGEARKGDTVRPCSEDAGPAMSVRR